MTPLLILVFGVHPPQLPALIFYMRL